jgi:hypothetical protein
MNNKSSGTSVDWSDIADYMGNSVTSQTALTVNGSAITLNPVGTSAAY